LLNTYASNSNVILVNTYVDSKPGINFLDTILHAYSVPVDFDFLSIDVDGCDWYIWDTLTNYRPRLIVIEFNPTIPNHVSFVQTHDFDTNHGASLRAMIELGKAKNYELVATTGWNAFFVRSEDFMKFNIEDNSIDAMHTLGKFESVFFQLYDGTVVLSGCNRLLWHDIPISHHDIQILPEALRKFADADNSNAYLGIRLADLKILNQALKRYHADHSAYPVSTGFDGLYTKWGQSKETWISGLTPKYIYALPREPRRNQQPDKQYLYRSDGKDYKLICHGAEDSQEVAQTTPELMDPVRKTWAYGYWTEGAESW